MGFPWEIIFPTEKLLDIFKEPFGLNIDIFLHDIYDPYSESKLESRTRKVTFRSNNFGISDFPWESHGKCKIPKIVIEKVTLCVSLSNFDSE